MLPGGTAWDADVMGRAPSTITADADDIVPVAESTDTIYPGLELVDRVQGGDTNDAVHTIIDGENLHALEALTYTHAGQIDCIYIDPPYNTGARDWKYNNDYVDTRDAYRHSKWLTFMERRLLVAKQLLNPDDSVLIVSIDEKEYLRLGLLLEQTFPGARIQMVSSVINRTGVARKSQFGRSDEYLFFVQLGASGPEPTPLESEWYPTNRVPYGGKLHWDSLMRTGTNRLRIDSPGAYYPIFVRQDEDGNKQVVCGFLVTVVLRCVGGGRVQRNGVVGNRHAVSADGQHRCVANGGRGRVVADGECDEYTAPAGGGVGELEHVEHTAVWVGDVEPLHVVVVWSGERPCVGAVCRVVVDLGCRR